MTTGHSAMDGFAKDQRLVIFGDSLPRRARNLGLDLMPIDRAGEFTIQDGSVLANVVYVVHPVRADVLVPFADYDEQVARDKLQEALRILNKLGAAEILASEERVQERTVDARLPFGKLKSATLRRSSSVQHKVAYEQKGTGSQPADPRPLRYPGEPGFESACDGVLVNGVKRLKIEIIRESQFSLDGDIASTLKKAGLNLGASYRKSELRTFVIEAAFKGAALPERAGVPTESDSSPRKRAGRRRD